MKFSQYYLPTIKETPSEAKILSHRLMLKAGLIKQTTSGIYSWLPLGLAVLKNIKSLIRSEQNKYGAIEFLMPTIQSADLWKKSGRYTDYGKEMLKITDRNNNELLYGPTNEELVTEIVAKDIKSYKDLPKILYHIQWKFRDEIRPRHGIMRCREFLMKDAYSFDINHEEALYSYNKMFVSYLNIFKAIGLTVLPVLADTGPIGGELSHEFVVLTDAGETQVYFDKSLLDIGSVVSEKLIRSELDNLVNSYTKKYSVTEDRYNVDSFYKEVLPENRKTMRGIEVGHIFYFGSKYSEKLNASVVNSNGSKADIQMGSYGIGVSRLVGAIIEANSDDKGIIWPKSVAPFILGIINLRQDNQECVSLCEKIYSQSIKKYSVLYDDRNIRAGEKLADMDLIGIPFHLLIGPKGIKENLLEVKNRATGEITKLPASELINYLSEVI